MKKKRKKTKKEEEKYWFWRDRELGAGMETIFYYIVYPI